MNVLCLANRRSFTLGVVLLVALYAAGCRPSDSETPPELEAVDVEPALTIDIESDQQAVQRPPELTGILPDDFPKDLPLHLPASLVDFGTADSGWYYVNLLSAQPQSRLERELSSLLAQRGWQVTGNGNSRQLRKGGQRARLVLEDARPGTNYRYEYPP